MPIHVIVGPERMLDQEKLLLKAGANITVGPFVQARQQPHAFGLTFGLALA